MSDPSLFSQLTEKCRQQADEIERLTADRDQLQYCNDICGERIRSQHDRIKVLECAYGHDPDGFCNKCGWMGNIAAADKEVT